MPVSLFDSLTRTRRLLQPAHADGVFRFYTCGPTVYAPAHIGNFRTFVVNDVLRRVLELEFGPDRVRHVRNITDVDDKTIRRAREEGRPLVTVTRQWIDKFQADCRALRCRRPHLEPTATGHIAEQVAMIDTLLEKGHAYVAADGSTYFKVASFAEYGRLSRVKERELLAGAAAPAQAQSADADEKEDGSDFALWKAWKPEDGSVSWPGPRGAAAGRPGWHIECSAMSKQHLGDTIDLHSGGVDLLFPHHENEIAQSECCNGVPFARHWYHSEHLLVDGKKMSKSLGNLYTLDQIVEKGFTPMALRLALLQGHPRKQLNFTLDSLRAAESALQRIAAVLDRAGQQAGLAPARSLQLAPAALPTLLHPEPASPFAASWLALCDDLNTPAALGEFFVALQAIETGKVSASRLPTEISCALTVLTALGLQPTLAARSEAPTEVAELAERRWAAKKAKDFAAADALRKEIAALGWTMLDGKDGYSLQRA